MCDTTSGSHTKSPFSSPPLLVFSFYFMPWVHFTSISLRSCRENFRKQTWGMLLFTLRGRWYITFVSLGDFCLSLYLFDPTTTNSTISQCSKLQLLLFDLLLITVSFGHCYYLCTQNNSRWVKFTACYTSGKFWRSIQEWLHKFYSTKWHWPHVAGSQSYLKE